MTEKLYLIGTTLIICILVGWGFDIEQGRWFQQAALIGGGVSAGLMIAAIFNGDKHD